MKAKKVLSCVFLLCASAWAFQGRAQSYAPETEYHDAIQRMFVVEAARVLAWRANQTGDHIAEVTYQVTTTNQSATAGSSNRSAEVTFTNRHDAVVSTNNTIWRIKWLDAEGQAIRSVKVEYPEMLLKQGADFYRQSFQQLWAAGWKSPRMTNCSALENAFWQGAGQAGWSREQSLRTASELLETIRKQENDDWIPQMAGLLVHSALPGVAGNLSLDRVLAARGAAWLALAEQTCARQVARQWSPVLFLAGREQTAAKVWGTNPVPIQIANEVTRGWELWLHRPTTKESYFFAVDSDCQPIALAMLAYDVQANESWHLLAEMLEPLAGSQERLTSWHNYGPLLARWAGIGGGRILEGAWPVYQRRAWLDLLKRCPPMPQEELNLTNDLEFAAEAPTELNDFDPEFDACLTGFTNFAPLLRMGFSKGTGKLVPTAVVTGRDLLNYGWESTGLQMGERYTFVQWRWGVPDLAKPILQITTREVPGLMPFFLNASAANTYNYQELLRRLQIVDGFQQRRGWSPNPFWRDGKAAESTATFVRRCWLRSSEFEWQARSLWDDAQFDRINELVGVIKSEGGPLAAKRALGYVANLGSDIPTAARPISTNAPGLAAMLPQPSVLWVRALWDEKFVHLGTPNKAREMEKTYWLNPDCGVENWVLHYYGQAGLFQAARRFYLQARENFLDPVSVSGGVGQTAFVLGYCLQDQGLREMALEDSASASYNDMVMHIWDAAIRDDRKELQGITDELIERYEPKAGEESAGRKLRGFLPLLDALADPKDARHQEAIDYFGNYRHWNFPRWIWVEKFKLPREEAIAFLGGREAGGFVHPLVCVLEENVEAAMQALKKSIRQNNIAAPFSVLVSYNCRKLAKEDLDATSPDLKPVGATPTRTAVLARLKAKRR